MDSGHFFAFEWLQLVQHELLLFAGVFFAIGAIDELAVDFAYFWLRITGRARDRIVDERQLDSSPLSGHAAVFIPAWQEAGVIGATIAHALAAWPQDQVTVYVGCYPNDSDTIAAAAAAAAEDRRVRIVVHDVAGPTNKPDCLNRIYRALREDERGRGENARMVVLHDAEDMVDPAALALLDRALWDSDFVQLPVLALPQRNSRWIGSHYADEFAESHGKAMVVRDALGGGVPGAGVGCAVARDFLRRLDAHGDGSGPFASQSLTEDYELGLRIAALGGRGRFLRARTRDGRLIATRAYFPADLVGAVRQKARWMHGIALQGWDRLGWSGTPAQRWMQLRDRRGPLAAIVLSCAYLFLILGAVGWVGISLGLADAVPPSPTLTALLLFNLACFLWRALLRFHFTRREYGVVEAMLSAPRLVFANIVAIMAGRRALASYLGSFFGKAVIWDKTEHRHHPAFVQAGAFTA